MKLIAQTGPAADQEFLLTKPVITIGRVAGNGIVLRDPHASRRHAQVRRERGGFVIVDLHSTNGTLVNERRIGAPRRLRDGDQVTIGVSTFRFQAKVEPAAFAAESPTERRTLPGRAARPARIGASPWPIIGAALGAVLSVLLIILIFGRREEPGIALPSPTAVTGIGQPPMAASPDTPTAAPTDTSIPSPTSTPNATSTPAPASTDTLTSSPTSTLLPTAALTPLPDAVVKVAGLNLRAGPGTVYDIIGGLYEGDELEVLARSAAGDWLEVMNTGGTRGWVAAAHVALNISPAMIPEATAIPSTPTPSLATATPLPLPPPQRGGRIEAGGKAEVSITNDSPYVLTLIFSGPTSTTVQAERCPGCKEYVGSGPYTCPSARPKRRIQLTPGTYAVTARVDAPGVSAYAGTWTLEGNVEYYECFFVVAGS